MVSPSGIKMQKVVEETVTKSPSGYDMISQQIKWKPIETSFEEQEILPNGEILSTKSIISPNTQTFITKQVTPEVTVITKQESPVRSSKRYPLPPSNVQILHSELHGDGEADSNFNPEQLSSKNEQRDER